MTTTPYANAIAQRMFVSTADRNYILARLAFFEELDLDFFWLSLHALEKYYKAVLLMNGQGARSYGHNVLALHAAVLKLEPRLPIGPLVDPGIKDLCWRDGSVETYLQRLNEFGSAANRYATYGHCLHPDDLFKVDQLAWSVRRCCRPFRGTLAQSNGGEVKIDYVDQLRRNPRCWIVGGSMPIEKLMKASTEDSRRTKFLYLNTQFAPGAQHVLTNWRASSSNPPLADWFMRLNSPDAALDTRQTAAEVLTWAVDHIKLSPADEKEIRSALAAYTASVRR